MVLQSRFIAVTNMAGACLGDVPVEGSIEIPAGDYADLMRGVDGNVVEDWSGSIINGDFIQSSIVDAKPCLCRVLFLYKEYWGAPSRVGVLYYAIL